VRMCKLPPDGTRGYNPFTRAGNYLNLRNLAPAGKLENAFGLTCVIVETKNALAELQAVCETPMLDMVYIGLYDLSVCLGFNGNTRDPALEKIVWDSVATIRKAGKAASIMVRSPREMSLALERGANALVWGVDTMVIGDAVSGVVRQLREQKNSTGNA
jgi:4-hydroxy-2-oxoheptanedioate aldolase